MNNKMKVSESAKQVLYLREALVDRSLRFTPKPTPKADAIGKAAVHVVDYPRFFTAEPEAIRVWLKGVMRGKVTFHGQGLSKLIHLAASCIGTHGFKTLNPTAVEPPIHARVVPVLKGSTLHESAIRMDRPLIFSGNSGDLCFVGFLLAICFLDDNRVTALDSIVNGAGLFPFLLEAGLTEEGAAAIRAAYLQSKERDLATLPIHPLSKQVYFESDLDCLLVQPINADSLFGEMQKRLRLISASTRMPRGVSIKVGGMNPQNVNKVYKETCNGNVRLAMAVPPDLRSDFDQHIEMLRKHGTIFKPGAVDSRAIDGFLSAIPENQTGGTDQDRRSERIVFRKLASACLDDAFALREYLSFGGTDDPSDLLENCDVRLARWLTGKPLDRAETAWLAEEVFNRCLAENKKHQGWRTRLLAPNVRKTLLETIAEYL